MNAIAHDELDSLLSRRPFVVLGYSAEGSVWCPTCLRSAAGLSPQRGTDYDGKPIVPLHARDASVREEACDNCGRSLLELLLRHEAARSRPAVPVTASLHHYGKAWALSFNEAPPSYIRVQLKQGAWRWESRYRLWWCATREPQIPAGITLPRDDVREPQTHRAAMSPAQRPCATAAKGRLPA